MIRRIYIAISIALLTACGGITPPNPPPSRLLDLSVVVIQPGGIRVPNATVTIDGLPLTANANGWVLTHVAAGDHSVQATGPEYKTSELVYYHVTRHTRRVVLIEPLTPRPPPIGTLTADGRIFRSDGQPWRWRGVSAFKLLNQHANGQDITPFLTAVRGFNVLRVFWYVTWSGTGWEPASAEQVIAFCNRVAADGFYVELTLLTDDDPARIAPAQQLVRDLAATPPANLVIEIGNEPTTHKNINTRALQSVLDASPFLYSSGNYEDSNLFFGRYLTAHTPRDNEWPRKSHDLLEYYNGGGPSAPTDPAHHVPAVADEPARPDEFGFVDADYLAYFASSSLLGAGATFHYDGGKYANLPTGDEARCMAAALAGLMAFPDDAPLGPYTRIDEQGATLRTYKVGPYTVRVRPLDGRVIP